MTKVFENVGDWLTQRHRLNLKIGFVPTMGALHEGHLSLVQRSRAENDVTLVSVFVNPTQFNDAEDFKNYPRTLHNDLKLLEKASADFLLLPKYEELYSDNYRYQVQENELSQKLCGAHRPGHFTGVLTVVMKLLNIAGANRAYFGEKDYQQLQLVKDMAKAFFMPVEIIGCPILRETDGLAMSSRNLRLTPEERKIAPLLYELLRSQRDCAQIKTDLESAGFKIDYIEERFGRRFAAAFLGKVRLIDNVAL
jgi:pantoate--beta-alanine ligase